MRQTRGYCDNCKTSHDTKRSSKRLRGNDARGKGSLPGMTQWRDLPWELQKSVLASRALSLRDLAKMAPLGKVFKEAYLERCAAEEEWLEQATKSVYGTSAIDTLASWLSCQKSRHKSQGRNPVPRELLLAEGEPWPDLRSTPPRRYTLVYQPARFLPGDPQPQNMWWGLYHGSKFRGVIKAGIPPTFDLQIFSLRCSGRLVWCDLSPTAAAQVVPCLGLAYLACKKAAEPLRTLRSPAAIQRLGTRWRYPRRAGLTSHWNQPGDAVRVLTLMKMRLGTSWRDKINLFPSLDGKNLEG
eukprot:jgi/Botrbrau1/10922/Bobra.0025s0095.1